MNRPRECCNANCVAMCSPVDYEFLSGFFKGNAKNCPRYKEGNDKGNERIKAELEEIKAEINNIRDVEVTDGIIYVNIFNVFDILDKHIKENKQ